MPAEPHATAVVLLAVGALLTLSVIAGRVVRRAGIPVVLSFVALGMLAGAQGIGRIPFEEYGLTYRVGTLALVLILFDGGLRTPFEAVKRAIGTAGTLATLGVVLTAVLLSGGASVLGFSWLQGLLLGAVVSSTDSATVFAVLRGGGVQIAPRVASLVELESGLNDPMAAILTVAFTAALMSGRLPNPWTLALHAAAQLAVGALLGAAVGAAARLLVTHVRLRSAGLYPVLTVGLAFLAYGVASLLAGSGLLAAYVAGMVLGNGRIPNRPTLLRVHDFVAWASQVGMFVVLGLLVRPSRLLAVAPLGVALALLLALVVRPLATAACLVPLRVRAREIALVGWLGLRGAVPIIFALIPVLAGAPGAEIIFDLVFFVVLFSAVLQGGTVRWVTRRLGLGTDEPAMPEALLEIESTRALDVELITFQIAPASAVCGARVADIPFPPRSAALLVVRGSELLAPKGDVELRAGDHVFVFCALEDVALVRLLFGREAE